MSTSQEPINDPANQYLIEQIRLASPSQAQLWLADENTLGDIQTISSCAPAMHFISNRFDVADELSAQNLNCQFSDFDFDAIENNSLDGIYYRVSKEKPVVHHIINQSYLKLKPGGKLFVAGQKNEGIKTYFSKLKLLFAGSAALEKRGLVYAGFAEKHPLANTEPGALQTEGDLDTKNYRELRPVADLEPSTTNTLKEPLRIHSKPGLFGWNKVDQGSAFLIAHLNNILKQRQQKPVSILDLGCGYGYLSLMTRDMPLQRRCATDNNAAALHAAAHNFERNGMEVEVLADNCAAGIREKFDLILCNPPFHQGFSIDGDLTDKFIRNTYARLSSGGTAVFVVNQFIPLERKAQSLFKEVKLAASNRSFKLIQLDI